MKIALNELKQLVRDEIRASLERERLSEAMYIDDLAAINRDAAASWVNLVRSRFLGQARRNEKINNSVFEVEDKNNILASLPGVSVSYAWDGKKWVENV